MLVRRASLVFRSLVNRSISAFMLSSSVCNAMLRSASFPQSHLMKVPPCHVKIVPLPPATVSSWASVSSPSDTIFSTSASENLYPFAFAAFTIAAWSVPAALILVAQGLVGLQVIGKPFDFRVHAQLLIGGDCGRAAIVCFSAHCVNKFRVFDRCTSRRDRIIH